MSPESELPSSEQVARIQSKLEPVRKAIDLVESSDDPTSHDVRLEVASLNVLKNIEEAVSATEQMAKEVQESQDMQGEDSGISSLMGLSSLTGRPIDQMKAKTVEAVVFNFAHAIKNNLLRTPQDSATASVFEQLKTKLPNIVSDQNASHLHPLVNGILKSIDGEPYITFSSGKELETQFERDLLQMVGNIQVEKLLEDIVGKAIEEGKVAGVTDKTVLLTKITNAKQKIQTNRPKESDRYEQMYEAQIENLLRQEIQSGETDAIEALQLFKSMKSPKEMQEFYLMLSEKYGGGREGSKRIHKLFQYLVHKVFAPVIAGSTSGKSYNELVQEATRSGIFGIGPIQGFQTITMKLRTLIDEVNIIDPEFDRGGHTYYQYGNEDTITWASDEDNQGNKRGGRQVVSRIISDDMVTSHGYREFLEGFLIALEEEKNLIEGGTNWNHLVSTGETDQQTTFYQQAKAYAAKTMKASTLDVLYRLPDSELVHAAKVVLSSYMRKKFAEERFRKRPDFFNEFFADHNTVEHAALIDSIRSFVNDDPRVGEKIPEWSIKRALLHARTHLSLVNQELLGLASYSHPYLTNDNNPSYLTPSLVNLEVNRVWSPAEQWQTSDAFAKGIAFLPKANREWCMEKWYPKLLKQQGERVFHRSARFGKLARLGHYYFENTADQNITDVNPLGIGGVEVMLGWRMKYAIRPWLQDLLDVHGNEDQLKLSNTTDMAEAWKRLENIGTSPLKWFVQETLFGPKNKFLDMDPSVGKAKKEAHLKDFYSFLFDRYFKHGVGSKALSMTFFDEKGRNRTVAYSDCANAEEFWQKVIEPIVNRKPRRGEDTFGRKEQVTSAIKRNNTERHAYLNQIAQQALQVLSFERLPIDFITLEDPTMSQNGITFLQELKDQFVSSNEVLDPYKNAQENAEFSNALNDLIFVQGKARMKANQAMSESIKQQKEVQRKLREQGSRKPQVVTTYGHTEDDLRQIRSNITISEIQRHNPDKPNGYYVDADIAREYLIEKYQRLVQKGEITESEANRRIQKAIHVYAEIHRRLMLKPARHAMEAHVAHSTLETFVDGTYITEEMIREEMEIAGVIKRFPSTDYFLTKDFQKRKRKFLPKYMAQVKESFRKERDNSMSNRFVWAGNEFLSPRSALSPNDTAYPFIYFSAAGENMVERTLDQITTQEELKTYLTGDFISQIKGYVRDANNEQLLKSISTLRNTLKLWYGDIMFNGKTLETVENIVSALRIDSDVESGPLGPLRGIAFNKLFDPDHPPSELSFYDALVQEGPRNNLTREERTQFLDPYLKKAQFPKYTPEDHRVWKEMGFDPDNLGFVKRKIYNRIKKYEEEPDTNFLIEKILAPLATFFIGGEEGKILRDRSKELSAIGAEHRQFATFQLQLKKEGPTLLLLLTMALFLIVVYQSAKETLLDSK